MFCYLCDSKENEENYQFDRFINLKINKYNFGVTCKIHGENIIKSLKNKSDEEIINAYLNFKFECKITIKCYKTLYGIEYK